MWTLGRQNHGFVECLDIFCDFIRYKNGIVNRIFIQLTVFKSNQTIFVYQFYFR